MRQRAALVNRHRRAAQTDTLLPAAPILSPAAQRRCQQAEKLVLQDYFDDASGKGPRYYQVNAVNAAIEAIAKPRARHVGGSGVAHRSGNPR